MAEPVARIGEQRSDGPVADCGHQLVDAFGGREIGVHGRDHVRAFRFEILRDLADARLIGRDHEIMAVLGREQSQMIADAGRRAGDDGERTSGSRHGICTPI